MGLMATKTRKRATTPKRYKTPLYDRMRRQAIKPTNLWAKLTAAARRKLEKAGYDQPSWDNNCRETVSVSHLDLIHTGGSSSPVLVTIPKICGRRGRGRKRLDDLDAISKAVFNE